MARKYFFIFSFYTFYTDLIYPQPDELGVFHSVQNSRIKTLANPEGKPTASNGACF